MIDDRLATLSKDAPRYYEAYQAAIEEYSIECAIAKVYCSEVLADVVDDVVQIHGGYGFTQEYKAERYYRDERINRIFEGTNEINRLLIPGTILRRALKGELPLQAGGDEGDRGDDDALARRARPRPIRSPPRRPPSPNLKKVFLVVAGAAVQKHGEKIKDEQEVLLALADVVIQIFAMESALLRAEKIAPGAADGSAARSCAAAVKVHAFSAVEKVATAARRAAFYVAEGDAAHDAARRASAASRSTTPTGLLEAKRALAEAVVAAERYPL